MILSRKLLASWFRFLVLCLVLSAGATVPSQGQELNCVVQVNADNVQATDKSVFQDMEEAFTNFLNDRQWTDDEFEPQERIKCSLVINIESMPEIGRFNATAQIQSARPVYNAGYETLVFNLLADEDWTFQYVQSQPLEFNQNVFTSNLTSMLAFYAYVIIGLDYDSFEKMGGSEFFDIANNIVSNAQGKNYPGWEAFNSSRNRYWLVDDLLNQQLQPVREGIYTYHRKGLDIFLEKPEEARENIVDVLKAIEKAQKVKPNSILLRTFFDAKMDELVSIFIKGDPSLKQEAYTILTKVDPTETATYKAIVE